MEYLSTAVSAVTTGAKFFGSATDPLRAPVSAISVICALAEAAIHRAPCCINIDKARAYCEIKGVSTSAGRMVSGSSREQLMGLAYHMKICCDLLKPSEGGPGSRRSSDADSPVKDITSLQSKIHQLFRLALAGLTQYIVPHYTDRIETRLALMNTHARILREGLEKPMIDPSIFTQEPDSDTKTKIEKMCIIWMRDSSFLDLVSTSLIAANAIVEVSGAYVAACDPHLNTARSQIEIMVARELREEAPSEEGSLEVESAPATVPHPTPESSQTVSAAASGPAIKKKGGK